MLLETSYVHVHLYTCVQYTFQDEGYYIAWQVYHEIHNFIGKTFYMPGYIGIRPETT